MVKASLDARFTQLAEGSPTWPWEFSAAQTVKIKLLPLAPELAVGVVGARAAAEPNRPKVRVAAATSSRPQIQDLGDLIPALLEIKAKGKVAMKFHVRLELGDGKTKPSDEVVAEVNAAFKGLDDGFRIA